MGYSLNRKEYRSDGIFSEFLTPFGALIAMTLEHAYPVEGSSAFAPKVLPGVYTCVRGMHRLHGMEEDFETFEITGVPGHTGILFHWGNYNADSDGCVLTGSQIGNTLSGGKMVTNSRATHAHFMASMSGIDSFPLTVSE
jgi:hypothetical protein